MTGPHVVAGRRPMSTSVSRWALVAVAALFVMLIAVASPLAHLAHVGISGGSLVFLPFFAAVGFVLAWRRPDNPLGWLMVSAMLCFGVQGDASLYVVADYRLRHGSLPLGSVALLLQPAWAPAIVLFGLLVLLFPDGRLPSPRWRWVLGVYLAVAGLWIVGAMAITVAAVASGSIQVDSGGNLDQLGNPTGSASWWGAVQGLFFPILLACWLLSIGAQAASFRKSTGERRQQLKWLVAGSAIAVVGGFTTIALSGDASPVLRSIGSAAILGVIAVPVSMAVAVLRYRLYDIDRLISRTLAYAVVTGLLVAVYVGLVTVASVVTTSTSPVVVAVSTLVVAALFNPLRRRVQAGVDRRFNRAPYDAQAAVAGLRLRLQDALDVDTVSAELLATVTGCLSPAQVSVWTADSTP